MKELIDKIETMIDNMKFDCRSDWASASQIQDAEIDINELIQIKKSLQFLHDEGGEIFENNNEIK
jgi:hypothetical protein